MSKTVPLEYPVTHDGTTYTELVMRRPTKRDDMDARRAESDDADREGRMFANLCEIAPDVVDELDLADYLAMQDAFNEMIADTSGAFEQRERDGVMTLGYPVTHDGTTYTELVMRRPKVREEKAARKGTASAAEQEIKLFAKICEVASAVLDAMDLADYNKLQDGYLGFFPRRPAPT